MFQHLTITLCVFCIAFILPYKASAQDHSSFILKNCTVVTGDKNDKPFIGSILIEQGYISAITAKTIDQRKYPNFQIIDCTNKFVTPGLIDAHVHLATIDLTDLEKAQKSTDLILENFVRNGITTVRDMAGYAPYLKEYQTQSESGKKIAPSIFYAAQFAGPSYFEMFNRGGSRQKSGISPWERAVSDTTDIAAAVLDAKNSGVTAIKTYADLSKPVLAAIVKEARKYNLLVWSHATIFPIRPLDAVALKVNSISHAADVLFQQLPADSVDVGYAWQKVYAGFKPDSLQLAPLFELMKKNKVYLDATLYHASNNKLTYAQDITRWAHHHGVKIVSGTDWIYPEKDEIGPLYHEAKILNEKCDLNNQEVLETLTLNAALATGLKDRGVIKKGYRGDLLILDNNPLENIKNAFQPSKVFKKGQMIFKR